MRFLRYSAPPFILCAVLAACGGGGGGGGVTPPGGGGGGGGGGSTPTPSPSHSSSPTPTPTVAPTVQPSATSVPVDSGYTVNATENFGPNGALWYTSGTASWANTAGDVASSPANGSPFEGMTCADTQEGQNYPPTQYAQHMFVGIYTGGANQQYPNGLEALPQALGMINPVAPTQGQPHHDNNYQEVEQYQCEYNVHTHDYSGLVHIEDITLPQNESYTYALPYATLQTLLDEWGATLSSSGLSAGSNSLPGSYQIYVGIPSGQDGHGNDLVTSYTATNAAPANIPLARHNAVWIVIGQFPAAGLPQVVFGEVN